MPQNTGTPVLPNTVGMVFMTTLFVLVFLPACLASATHKFHVQALVVVDEKGFQTWKTTTGKSTEDELKEELTAQMVDVADLYKGLKKFDPPLSFGFEILDIEVLSYNFLFDKIKAYTALKKLEDWSKGQNKKFDIVLLYTGFDLVSVTQSAHGAAFIGKICTEESMAMIEIQSIYKDSLTVAHEFAHSFGSVHDQEPKAKACLRDNHYMMANVIDVTNSNHFIFSKCTYDLIYKHLVTDGNGACMKDGDANKLVKGPRTGKILSPDDQCKRVFGKESRVDRHHYYKTSYQKDDLCTKLKCVCRASKCLNDEREKYTATSQGTPCGKNKVCVLGKCVKTSYANSQTLDSCPLGDRSGVIYKRGSKQFTCTTLPEGACFQWKGECCQACSKFEVSEADAACKRLQGPESALVRDKYRNWGDELCAKLHCLEHFGANWDSNVYDTPEGMKCGKNKVCKNKKCVKAEKGVDKGDPNMPDYCPYGDQPWIPGGYQLTCPQAYKKDGCGRLISEPCCVTCVDDDHVPVLDKTADDVCREAKGDGWSFNRGHYNRDYTKLCSDFQCVTTRGNSLVGETLPVPNGLTCDRRKVCYNGKCRRATKGAPYARDFCPAHDHPFKIIGDDGKTFSCKERPRCEGSVKKWCCRLCEGF